MALTVFGGAANATTITFDGPCSGGGECSADATFTFGSGVLTLVVNNDDSNPSSAAQLLSGIMFTLSDGSAGNLNNNIALTHGQQLTVARDGTFSTGSTVAPGWAFSETGTTFKLDDLGPGAAGPSNTLIGAPDPGGRYSDANNSIAGNGPHNPFLGNSVTWTINIQGVTEQTTVTAASFQFGTADGNFQLACSNGDCDGGTVQSTAPEPISLVLTGAGLLGVGLLRRLSVA